MVVVDISILRGTEFVHQFPGGVEVTLDIPAGYEEANTKVFRMDADGTATDMQAVCKDGKAAVSYTHLDVYKRQSIFHVISGKQGIVFTDVGMGCDAEFQKCGSLFVQPLFCQ